MEEVLPQDELEGEEVELQEGEDDLGISYDQAEDEHPTDQEEVEVPNNHPAFTKMICMKCKNIFYGVCSVVGRGVI